MSGVQILDVTEEDDGIRLDRWIKRHFPNIGHGQLQKLLRTGQVRVDGGRAKAATRLSPGQKVRVPPVADKPAGTAKTKPPGGRAVSRADAESLQSRVLYRDDDVLAIDKPAGLAVQGGSGTARHLDGMLDALRFEKPERPRLVHRLDKDTSGVLLLARSAAAARWLTGAFRAKSARKLYWAATVGSLKTDTGRIDLPVGKARGAGGERMVIDHDNGKEAVSIYAVVDRAGRQASWVALEPLTGRTHQLRVHMASLGCPILGDGKYGGRQAFLPLEGLSKRLHLHARRLLVETPTGVTIDVSAPPPEHLRETWNMLGFDPGAGAGSRASTGQNGFGGPNNFGADAFLER